MKKYDLLRSGDNIFRVLDVQGDRVLAIDCIKRKMPVWMGLDALESYSECICGELSEVTGVVPVGVDDLDADQRKVMYERYTMIAPILAFIANDRMRSRLICSVAEEHGVSKQTVRSYLCLYLAHMDVVALAPNHKKDSRELTQDEKNIRWALNKFFYTTKKQSLINVFSPDALRMITRDRLIEDVVMKHTMFPYYGRFLPLERRQRAFQALVSMQGNYHNLLPIPTRKGDTDRCLRYCPVCAELDRQEHGETYWHRTHQMIGLAACPVHGWEGSRSHQ